jgi:succinate dehydrogenase / fumarate reductase cytochrome b subunit
VSVAYVAAMIPLGLHLYHGIWSAFQTMGVNNPRFNAWRRPFAMAMAALVVAGNVSFPLAVLAGVVG